MITTVYTVRDVVADVFLPPFTFRSDAEAKRAFEGSIMNTHTPMGQHPKDFALFAVGIWDDQKGEVTPLSEKKLIDNGEMVLNRNHRRVDNGELFAERDGSQLFEGTSSGDSALEL